MKKPLPLTELVERNKCPICGKSSYSAGGTHPQCAVARADAAERVALKAEHKAEKKPPNWNRQWSKVCPKCQRQLPARRVVCDCGHQFPVTVPK